jgi:hypothetical protein
MSSSIAGLWCTMHVEVDLSAELNANRQKSCPTIHECAIARTPEESKA